MSQHPGAKADRLLLLVLGVYLTLAIARLSPSTHAQPALTQPVGYLPAIFFNPPSPTPAPGRPLISEVMYDHETASDEGEWIELYNAGDFTFNLSGYKLGDEETQGGHEGMYIFPDGTMIASRQVIVIASKGAVFRHLYGFPPTFELNNTDLNVPELSRDTAWSDGSLGLMNDGDEVILLDQLNQPADSVVWGNGHPFFHPTVPKVASGHTLERYPPYYDSNTALDWRDQPAPLPGAVDMTTPTRTPLPTRAPTVTPTPTPSPALVINEILADPDTINGDANGDLYVSALDDEFIEIVNATGAAVDLSGWRLEDRFNLRHVFPDGTLLADGCAVVVFGGGNPTGGFGGSLIQVASTGALYLNNEEERVTLLDASQNPIAVVAYGLEADNNQSLTRNPDVTGPEPLVQHASIPASNGALFSPGVRLDGTYYSGCNLR